ncbi:hypothetical protein D6C97_05031 [Aureobasidium pullulans]|uniref:Uncharacterized protein n=1 Tax=Aureobasidium pullulans TaxID=5580 RepID=A0A4S8Y7Y8_AURPU|nr:hypothetical protein D6D22_02429 [Aureobasidium pullulans]THY56671.1 hypothetical protein D6C97_05031 [Aureobasidium pullulans]
MPPISPSFPIGELLSRNITAANGTGPGLRVVCAWPVSGQYGPGSRVLYYVLVVLCVFGKKTDWIKNACLAAVLLFPAVAALHGITLAALHNDNAVDMDIYGAFQLCSLGILAAPATVKNSRTYFLDPGRNIIFLWTGLILSGLLSLAVEFFRTKTRICHSDVAGPLTIANLNRGNTCGLTCNEQDGPFSPMRKDAASNIFVIPAPSRLTFGTVTLLCAACCIPAILSLISMWNKILEINWKSRSGAEAEKDPEERRVKDINNLIKRFLNVIEAPLFGVAVVVILILGEINLFSPQVRYQTEPIQSIGQWAPIVGTGLAVMGSLIVNITKATAVPESDSDSVQPPEGTDTNSISISSGQGSVTPNSDALNHQRTKSTDLVPVTTRRSMASTVLTDRGGRRKVAKFMTTIADYMGTPGHGQFDNTTFRRDASDYPKVPGEDERNPELGVTEKRYRPLSRSASRSSDMRMSSPFAQDLPQRRPRSDSEGARTIDSQDPPSPLTSGPSGITNPERRDTLEVPSAAHISLRDTLERSRNSNGSAG